MSKTVLITGTSSGFGKLTAETLLAKGYTVVATMRDVAGSNKEVAGAFQEKGALVAELEVTSDASVDAAISSVLSEVPQLDVVIQNAGVGIVGWQENFSPEDWERIFQVNVFGVQRVNRAIIPHMRERGSGLIVQISSLLGRMVIPSYGPYNASKWAVEAMAENYRVELAQFGIESCIVEPGGFPTAFKDHLIRPSDSDRSASYGTQAEFPEAFLKGFMQALAANQAQNPQLVADALSELIDMAPGERPFRTIVDKMGMGDALQPYNDMLDSIMRGTYGAFHIDHLLKLKQQ